MGKTKRLALLSNNQFEEAYEAYNKAIQLEPNNDGYKQNLKIVEEKLRGMSFGAGHSHAGVSIEYPISIRNNKISNMYNLKKTLLKILCLNIYM